jgi:hypothetical protein
MKQEIQPDGIVITISAGMLKEKGYRNWLRNFLDAMHRNDAGEEVYYFMRQGTSPKNGNISYVYLCIGNKIRYRAYYAGSRGPSEMTFLDGRTMSAKAWIILAGPVERAPTPIKMTGFRGFRYTQKLF